VVVVIVVILIVILYHYRQKSRTKSLLDYESEDVRNIPKVRPSTEMNQTQSQNTSKSKNYGSLEEELK